MSGLAATTGGVLFLHVYDGAILKEKIEIGRMVHDHDDAWRILVEDLKVAISNRTYHGHGGTWTFAIENSSPRVP